MLSDHYKGGMTERLLVRVVTVDPLSRKIEVVGKDAAVIQVNVALASTLFVWPTQGEFWTIVRENGDWLLEARVSNREDKSLDTLNPGEAMLQSNSIWTPNGDKLATQTSINLLNNRIAALESAALDARIAALESANLNARLLALETAPTYSFQAWMTSTQSVPTSSNARLAYNNDSTSGGRDDNDLYDAANAQYHTPVAGWYEFSASVALPTPGAANTRWFLYLFVNDVYVRKFAQDWTSSTWSNDMALTGHSGRIFVAANATVEVRINQNSGGPLTVGSSSLTISYFSGGFIG